jgi:hypothetical protein
LEIAGRRVFTGEPEAAIGLVRFDEMLAVPLEFVPRTVARSLCPRSAPLSRKFCPVAPGMSVHADPLALQRCHWKVKVIGLVPVHVPVSTLIVCPTT